MRPAGHGPVLVVDDHPLSRRLLEHVLELEEIEVVSAGSIAEAEHLLLDTQAVPRVIVLDLRLPDGYGLDLARRVKADPNTADCAIVACTAGSSHEQEAEAREAGCTAYVSKPIDTRQFGRLVSGLLS